MGDSPGNNEQKVPQTLGKYRIVAELGQGGMATVYKAKDDVLDKTVAVKVLRPELTKGEQYLERFRREAKIVASLEHPNIISVFDWGCQDGLYYFVMTYVEGVSVYELVYRHGRLPVGDGIRVCLDLLSALAYAHGRDVIHRDLKPENIMISRAGKAVLTDFGIARPIFGSKLTRVSQRVGTPIYMSPEQVKGIRLDHRSDLYSVGIALFEMLTGRLPFEGKDDIDTGRLHVTAPVPRPSSFNPGIGSAIEAVMVKALAKNPQDRFQSAQQMSDALSEAAKSENMLVPDLVVMSTIPKRLKPLIVPLPDGSQAKADNIMTVDEYLGDMQRKERTERFRASLWFIVFFVLSLVGFAVYRSSLSLVTLTTIPPGAEVEEGKQLWPGYTPFVMLRTAVGGHNLRIVKKGYKTVDLRIDVKPGKLSNINVVLEPAPLKRAGREPR